MSESSTSICNMALARLGAKRINTLDDSTNTDKATIYCRLFYTQTAKMLMRSHLWRFARAQSTLSQDTESPEFQWDYQYSLPSDFLRHILVYDGSDLKEGRTYVSYEIMGDKLYIDESSVDMKYIRFVESEGSWDPLFIEVMALQLAQKLCIPMTGGGKDGLALKSDIDIELYGDGRRTGRRGLMRKVRAMDRQEAENLGRDELRTWLDAMSSDSP